MGTSRYWFRWAGVVAFLTLAVHVEAHSEFSTKGPFVSGIKHFFLSLDDILVAVAMGIVASQNQVKTWKEVCWVFPSAWWLAGIVGLFSSQLGQSSELLSAGSLLVVGVLAAMSLAPAPLLVFLLTLLVGSLHGFLNGTAMHPATFSSGIWQMCGISASVVLVVIYPGVLLDIFKQPWARIVARVLGSWIAATGLLLIGWTLRLQK
jgi:urease accessory protein